jgi:uncharacterized protein (TIGR02246 family)
VHDAGAVVYQLGHFSETIAAKDGSTAPAKANNNFLARWVRDADGTFKLHRFFATPTPKEPQSANVTNNQGSAVGSIDERLARHQVGQSMDQVGATIRANDAAAFLTFWTDDAAFLGPEAQDIGKPAFSKAVTAFLDANRVSEFELKSEEIFVHDGGAAAYQYGTYTEVYQAKDGKSETVTERNQFVARWRRGADGHWRIDRFYATPQPKA